MFLEQVLDHVVKTFKSYSRADVKCGKLNQDELGKLMKEQFPMLCATGKEQESLDAVMGMMDVDKDQKVSFQEFATFLALIATEIESFVDPVKCLKNAKEDNLTLEQSAVYMLQIYNKYAGADGNMGELNQSELGKLVTEQFPELCDTGKDKEMLDTVMGLMDLDSDKNVTLQEYTVFLAILCMQMEEAE